MKKRTIHRESKLRKNPTDKLLCLPGVREAIRLVQEHAELRAMNEALDNAAKGELGDKARQLLSETTPEAPDEFFEDEVVDSFICDSIDEWLEILAVEAGTKISELWDLSKDAALQIARLIYWGESPPTRYSGSSIFVLLTHTKDAKVPEALGKRGLEFLERNTIILSTYQMEEGHIYLDVTYLPYRSLHLAYEAILLCRQYLGIVKKDLREGAPQAIDTERALKSVYLANTGKTNKEIAKELGLKIYSADNPSGSYPLLHKYLRRGLEIQQKLTDLDKFLASFNPP